MKTTLFLAALALVPLATRAADKGSCRLKKDDSVKLGCTYDCDSLQSALNDASERTGIAYQLVDLRKADDLDKVDAFISPGGHDPDPKYFNKRLSDKQKEVVQDVHNRLGNGGEKSPEYDRRDKFEDAILRKYLAGDQYKNMPFLGVCYGMQMLAATNDVPLVVDLKEQMGIDARREVDPVTLSKDSALMKYGAAGTFRGAEDHHQAVDGQFLKDNAGDFKNVKVTATSNGGKIPEVIELANRPAIGIQYHAELSADDAAQAPFNWLLAKACEKKTSGASPAARGTVPAKALSTIAK